MGNFDRIAKIYETLEFLVFGKTLQNAREALLPELVANEKATPKILIPGEGDGRLAKAVLEHLPQSKLFVTEASSEMRRKAQSRLSIAQLNQVTWTMNPSAAGKCDVLICAFYLDCFAADFQTEHLEGLLASSRPESLLIVDFIPAQELKNPVFRTWCACLQRSMLQFFRLTCKTEASQINNLEHLVNSEQWAIQRVNSFYGGFVKSTLWKKAKPCT